jgi:hypothetical protein
VCACGVLASAPGPRCSASGCGEEIEEKAHRPEWKARRWVVEACHSWLNRNRGILIRWSRKDESHLALLQLSSGLIAFKKAHLATHASTQRDRP